MALIDVKAHALVDKPRAQRGDKHRTHDGDGAGHHQVAFREHRAVNGQVDQAAKEIGDDQVKVIAHISIAPYLYIQPEHDAHNEYAGQHDAAMDSRLRQGEDPQLGADLDERREKRKYGHEDGDIDDE